LRVVMVVSPVGGEWGSSGMILPPGSARALPSAALRSRTRQVNELVYTFAHVQERRSQEITVQHYGRPGYP
jgi:hypothetical protein